LDGAKRLRTIYRDIGEECPFLAAERLGIQVSAHNLGDNLGIYARTSPIHRIIWLNVTCTHDIMADVCERLLINHLEADGVPVSIKSLKEKKTRSYLINILPTGSMTPPPMTT
jgi:hypothetical protein